MKHLSPQALKAFSDNYIWAFILPGSNHFVVVDPGDADVVTRFASEFNLELRYIFLTHYHQDHSAGLEKLKKHFPEVIVYGPNEVQNSKNRLVMGDFKFTILKTPGHTKCDICFWEENKEWLFCGDTLFSGGCGRVFDGAYEQLYLSLALLSNLPNKTKIFCAHEYTVKNLEFAHFIEPTNKDIVKHLTYYQNHPDEISLPSSIELEKRINPFFRLDSEEVQLSLKDQGFEITDPYSVFKSLRLSRNNY